MNAGKGFDLEGTTPCNDLNPKALMLFAAARCAGLTVLYLLERSRVEPRGFEISVAGELSTDTMRAETVFKSFNVVYNIRCARAADQTKVSRAVRMAHEQYCGMMQMLRRIAPVAHEVAIVSTEPAPAL